ncbi:MAG TPA: ribbon-helix-helix domain-containing protein [Syntrophobacteraceae bacterium]|nr:ribbon-helix-helix domain-containing protein [Syntrophobacteraceae bacterium]
MPLSVRLDSETEKKLEEVALNLDRSKDWVVKEAIRHYVEELADYEMALKRLADPDAKLIDHEEAKRALGLVD